jgi:DNA/RNA endonuclease YhcR with UshA esterase domain
MQIEFVRRLFVALAFVVLAAACAARTPSIAELKFNPGRYQDRTVAVEGVVTSSWNVPLVPFKLYRLDDGTGQVTVVANDGRVPTKGARVRVKGRVSEVATLGGQALGLHIQQRDVDFRR